MSAEEVAADEVERRDRQEMEERKAAGEWPFDATASELMRGADWSPSASKHERQWIGRTWWEFYAWWRRMRPGR